jgi:hypothetical protein
VWTPRDLDTSESQNRELLDRFGLAERVEVLRTGFEELVDYLGEVLHEPAPPDEVIDAHSRRIYLMCANQDLEEIARLRKPFEEHGLTIEIPVFGAQPREMREAQRRALQECDGVLLYWGRSPYQWLRANLDEAIRARRVIPRDRPPVLAVYAGEPRTEEKLKFEEPGVIIIHAEESPDRGPYDLVKLFAGGPAA